MIQKMKTIYLGLFSYLIIFVNLFRKNIVFKESYHRLFNCIKIKKDGKIFIFVTDFKFNLEINNALYIYIYIYL